MLVNMQCCLHWLITIGHLVQLVYTYIFYKKTSFPFWGIWVSSSWWHHQRETFFSSQTICLGNSPVPVEFPAQRPVKRSFDIFFHLRLNKRLSKQSWGWLFDMLSCPLWRHCNVDSANWLWAIWRLFVRSYSFYKMPKTFLMISLWLPMNSNKYSNGMFSRKPLLHNFDNFLSDFACTIHKTHQSYRLCLCNDIYIYIYQTMQNCSLCLHNDRICT